MNHSNSGIIWNVVLPIMVFLPMSYTATWLLFGPVELISKYVGENCPVPIQGNSPYQRQFVGGYAPWLENIFCIVVAFFHPLFQPDVVYIPAVIDFLAGSFSACALVPFLEASRSKRPLLLGFPVTMGVMYQIFTGALIFPPYWAVLIAMTSDHATGTEIVQADAEAVLFGLVLGFYLPTFAMAYIATVEATAVWQIFPILIYFFKSLHLLFRPRRLHNSSGYRTVQATYIIVFLISSIVRLRTFVAYNFDLHTIMVKLLPPLEIPAANVDRTAIAGIYLFMQWDIFFIVISTFTATLWFAASIVEGLLLITWILLSSPLLGPGATISGIFLWREAKLNHARQFPTSKLVKTQ